MMRLFIALPLEASVRKYLDKLIAELRERRADVKWVAPNNIHLTLRFLGDTDEKLVPKLSSIVDDVAAKYPHIETAIDKIGGFPNLHRPNIFWVGLKGQIDVLAKMAAQIENPIRACGYRPEIRQFRSHLTLGRVKKIRGIEILVAYLPLMRVDSIPVRFDRIILYESNLLPQGPEYRILHEAKLSG